MEYLIVDGYNVIYNEKWGKVFDKKKDTLEDCRDKLLKILSNYQGYKNNNILVIFDAYKVKSRKVVIESYDNISVVYTKENETADNFIERFIYNSSSEKNVMRVVTSDYLEQVTVLRLGGVRMTPEELKIDVDMTQKKARRQSSKNINETNTIMSNINSELLKKLDKMRKDDGNI
jgi:predicted RNA-binding protein with PIN domain